MKIFNLGNYDEETLYRFIEFSNNYWEDEWCIYINSGGGSVSIGGLIDEILNQKLFTDTSCYLNIARVYSSAFSTMMAFKGPINVLYTAKGMYHQTSFDTNLNLRGMETNTPMGNFNDIIKSSNRHELKKELDFCKTFMTDVELQNFKDGKDIYYNEKQLLTFIKQKIN